MNRFERAKKSCIVSLRTVVAFKGYCLLAIIVDGKRRYKYASPRAIQAAKRWLRKQSE